MPPVTRSQRAATTSQSHTRTPHRHASKEPRPTPRAAEPDRREPSNRTATAPQPNPSAVLRSPFARFALALRFAQQRASPQPTAMQKS